MRAVLIDPHRQTIEHVELKSEHRGEFHQYVVYEGDGVDFGMLPTGDQYCVDEWGYKRPGQRFFRIEGHSYVVPGRALVMGVGPEGETTEPSVTIEGWRRLVTWCPASMRFLRFDRIESERVHPVLGNMHHTEVRPIFEGEG